MGYKTEKKIPSIILSVFIVLLILVGTIVPAYAAPTQDMMVTDSGEMLSDREEQEVSEMLYSINRQTGIEYLVYTIKSLNGEDIETCANRLFRTAGLGDKEKDNGLLLLISYDDRKFRLEVGYGLEGDIPDTQAANIINTMTPYFKEGNYGDGVKAAVKQTAVILNSSGEYTISEDWAAQAASNDEASQTSSIIAAGLVLGICYLLLGYTFWLNWPETKENFYTCIVVSTSLIECGVDLDFPYGYRELAGLDSVLQTAGRINRNGKRDRNTCKLMVFEGPQDEVRALQGKGRPPEDYLHNEKNITKRLFTTEDITLPETATKYFESLYKYYKGALDEKGILKMAMPDDGKIQFQKIAENFHLIEEDTVTVIIPQTPEAVQLIAKLRNQTATRRDIRKVGKYSVNVRRKRYNDRLADVTEPLVMNAGKTVDICCLTDMHRYTEYGLEML